MLTNMLTRACSVFSTHYNADFFKNFGDTVSAARRRED